MKTRTDAQRLSLANPTEKSWGLCRCVRPLPSIGYIRYHLPRVTSLRLKPPPLLPSENLQSDNSMSAQLFVAFLTPVPAPQLPTGDPVVRAAEVRAGGI